MSTSFDDGPIARQGKKPILNGESRLSSIIRWMDSRILPTVSLLALSGLSVRGVQTIMLDISPTVQVASSVAIVAFLVVKAFNNTNV